MGRTLVRGHAGDSEHNTGRLHVLKGPCMQRQEVWEVGTKILHGPAAQAKQCGCHGLAPCGPVNQGLDFDDFYSQERCNLRGFWAELLAI